MNNPHTPTPGAGLIALVNEAQQLESQILVLAEEHGGEIDDKLDQFLTDIKTSIATKTDKYKFLLDRLEMASSMFDSQADQFYRASKALDSVASAMKDRIKEVMRLQGTDEVKGTQWRFKLSNTKGSLIIDAKAMDAVTNDARETTTAVIKRAIELAEKVRKGKGVTLDKEIQYLVDAVTDMEEASTKGLAPLTSLRITVEPDKAKIRDLIEAGSKVEGATIEPGFSLRAYVNKGTA